MKGRLTQFSHILGSVTFKSSMMLAFTAVVVASLAFGVEKLTASNDTSACASLRAHVNYIVRALYDVEVVLYDHYRAAAVRKPLQYIKKPLHIRNVKSGGRLVQHVERLTGIPAGKLGSELYPLRLAAR